MKQEFFKSQMARLQIRFGQRALDAEFIQLCWREVHDMSEHGFLRFVDVMIGSRSHNKPPLLSEFREARLNESKRQFENEVRQAAGVMYGGKSPGERKTHILGVLSREYGRVSSITDAVDIARIRLRTQLPLSGPEEGA